MWTHVLDPVTTGFGSFIITRRFLFFSNQLINTIQEILFCYLDVPGNRLEWPDKRRVMTFGLWHWCKDIPCYDICQVIALLKSIFAFLWGVIITQGWFFHPLYRLFCGHVTRSPTVNVIVISAAWSASMSHDITSEPISFGTYSHVFLSLSHLLFGLFKFPLD